MARKPRLPQPELSPALASAWHHAIDIAVATAQLAPWERVAPDAVLGVDHPDSRETDWCTVMGHANTVFGIAIYPGVAGYETLRRLPGIDEFDAQVAQLAITVTFESAATLAPESKRLLQRLGRRFRGARAWPEVLVHEPGMVPIPPWTAAQLDRVANAMTGVAAMVPWADLDPAGGTSPDPDRAWVTTPPFGDSNRRLQALPAPIAQPVELPPFDRLAVARLRAASKPTGGKWYLDWFCGLSVVDGPETEGRPYFNSHLILLDVGTGMMLGMNVGRLQTVAADLQALLLTVIERHGMPAVLVARRADVATALQPFAADLGVPLQHAPEMIAATRDVHSHFMRFLGR